MHSKRKKRFLFGKRTILCDQFSNRIHGIWRDTALHSLKTHDSLHTTHVHLPKHIETYIFQGERLRFCLLPRQRRNSPGIRWEAIARSG